MKIAIVGAGWAGMAAAVSAADAGLDVTVFEASRTLGGRARALSIKGPGGVPITLDNGQHILIGAYVQTLALMQRMGVTPTPALLRLPLGLPFPDGSGLRTPAWAIRWPAPLDAMAAIATAKGWCWRDRLALLRASAGWQQAGFACDPMLSVAGLCTHMPARVMRELVEPLCVSALNVPVTQASAQVFLNVMRDALFGQGFAGFGASNLLLPRTDLSQLFPLAAANWLQTRYPQRTRLHTGRRVTGVRAQNGRWALQGDDFETIFDRVIWATSANVAAQVMRQAGQSTMPHAGDLRDWSASAASLAFTSIATTYAWAPGARLSAPLLALHSSAAEGPFPAQFVFDRGQLAPHDPAQQGLLAFVVSASQGEGASIEARVLQQATTQLGLTKLQALRTVVEKRATFACTPGLQRPAQAMAPGLWAAADYIQGPYPATLEGAVRSGLTATASMLESPTPGL